MRQWVWVVGSVCVLSTLLAAAPEGRTKVKTLTLINGVAGKSKTSGYSRNQLATYGIELSYQLLANWSLWGQRVPGCAYTYQDLYGGILKALENKKAKGKGGDYELLLVPMAAVAKLMQSSAEHARINAYTQAQSGSKGSLKMRISILANYVGEITASKESSVMQTSSSPSSNDDSSGAPTPAPHIQRVVPDVSAQNPPVSGISTAEQPERVVDNSKNVPPLSVDAAAPHGGLEQVAPQVESVHSAPFLNGAQQLQSPPIDKQQKATLDNAAMIVAGILSALLGADVMVRKERSVLMRGLARGKESARALLKWFSATTRSGELPEQPTLVECLALAKDAGEEAVPAESAEEIK